VRALRRPTNWTHLGNIVTTASDYSRHQVVVSAEVLGSTVVDDICSVLEGALEVRTHHRVVDDDESVGTVLVDQRTDGGDISDLEERVRGRLEKDHGDVGCGVGEDGEERGGVGRRDVVGVDPVVGLEVSEESVRSAVEVVSSDDLVSWLEQAEYDIQCSHSRGNSKSVLS
jgi:hypothetical protein